jgi:nucleotide-binding universal stress UspA family protein
MKPFQAILVPVDFSPPSIEALHVAADLARRYSAQVTLVYVYEPLGRFVPDSYLFWNAEQVSTLLTHMKEDLESQRQLFEGIGATQVRTLVLQGVPADEIVAHARSLGADLIVMGTHGRTGLLHALMGSVAERVLRTAPCAVLAVR